MAFGISVSATTATSVTLDVTDPPGGGNTIQIQLAPTPTFSFGVCPIYTGYASAAQILMQKLNQRATYYARARTLVGGVLSDWCRTISFRTADGAAQVTNPAQVMIEPAFIVAPEIPHTVIQPEEAAGFPASNMFIDAPVGWKAAGEGGYEIQLGMSGSPISCLAVLNTNMPEDATLKVYAADTRAGLGDIGTRTIIYEGAFRASANLPGRRGYHALISFPVITKRWWSVQILGAPPANTFYAEHLILGFNRVSKNHSVEKTEAPLPRTTIERTRSGIPDRVDGIPMRKVEFDISLMTEQQYETTYSDLIYRENEPILVVPNSKGGAFLHDRILYGDLKGSRIINPSSPRFTRTFVIESLI